MDALDERLADLGRAVAEVNAPDHDAIADARRRWARSGRRPRRYRWTLVVAPALAIAATVIAIIVTRTPGDDDERPLTYTIADQPGDRGQWIAAREPVQLRFSDGSRVDVARDAKLRVAATDRRGGTIDLEQGGLHGEVAHRDGSTWRFRTGPYTVLVKGTRFDAAWDSARERFTLDMLEGKVEVTGPLIPAPITVLAGQSVVASVGEKRFEIRSVRTADASQTEDSHVARSAPSAPRSIDAPARPPAANVTDVGGPADASSRAAEPAPHGSAAPPPAPAPATLPATRTEKWREYLAASAYSSAIAAAEQRGFDAVVADATTAELYALSDAARYAGRLARARDALIAVRARGEQGRTAFLLGRIAADQGDAAAAIEWFDRYLQEQPAGPLAETATGRLIELYRPRDAGRARKLADRYLAAYPDGSYAALARTLVEKR